MIDTYHIPQKSHGVAQRVEIETTVRQSVEEAVRAALPPSIRAQQVDLTLHITVNIHLPSC
jgi:hypothetical protein